MSYQDNYPIQALKADVEGLRAEVAAVHLHCKSLEELVMFLSAKLEAEIKHKEMSQQLVALLKKRSESTA